MEARELELHSSDGSKQRVDLLPMTAAGDRFTQCGLSLMPPTPKD